MIDAGLPLPPDLRTLWDLWPSNQRYFDAFDELARARQWAIGATGGWPQPLEHTEIIAYARAHGFARTRRRLRVFTGLMQVQDAVWLDHHAKKSKAEQ